MKKHIPTQYLQINLANSDEIKNWAERSNRIPFPESSPIPSSAGRTGREATKGNMTKSSSATTIGEVRKADTLNYRTLKPEKDGLFCERIFGPTMDWVCSCGHTKERGQGRINLLEPKLSRQSLQNRGMQSINSASLPNFTHSSGAGYGSKKVDLPASLGSDFVKDTFSKAETVGQMIRSADSSTDHEKALRGEIPIKTCPLCGVEATTSRFRRYRMGYIGLACPVTHIWYLNSRPNLFALLLKMPTKYIKKITYYKAYSPSRALPEYLSALLGPGGDFFDNEWEFLHWWLAGKYSAQDQRAPWNLASTQYVGKADSSRIRFPSLAASLHKEDQASSHIRSADEIHDSLRTIRSANQAKPTSISSKLENGKSWKGSIAFFPALPNWLQNTGAQALLNQLETKNWKNEIRKLEKLIRLPKFYSNLDSVKETPGRPESISSSRSLQPFSRSGSINEIDSGYAKLDPAWPNPAKLELASPNILKKRKNHVRQLKLLLSFQKSGFPITQMIFSNLPVLPPELRPIIQLGAGQLASSDVNDLYRRVISRNNRLKYYLYETHFVEFLVRSEQQLVQLAVDALLENGKTTQVRHTSGQKRLYKSLSDRIGGKQGRFRMNLLGKRVDYSGRSVIIVGPQLHISNCGLPYEMAFELFQPFLLRHCIESLQCKTIRSAKNLLRLNKAFSRHILHAIISSHPILLNRAPTLHRLGIQAFQPLLVFGRAIHLHPLVCPAFNADFDGDQMAVHIPLSPSARVEARLLMLSSGNWLSASTGQPNLLPSQDMVLGFYYVTLEKYGFQKGKGLIYQNPSDALQAYECGEIDLHSQIWLRMSESRNSIRFIREEDKLPALGNIITAPPMKADYAMRCEANNVSLNLDSVKDTLDGGFVIRKADMQNKSGKPDLSMKYLWIQKKAYQSITGDSVNRKMTPIEHKKGEGNTDPQSGLQSLIQNLKTYRLQRAQSIRFADKISSESSEAGNPALKPPGIPALLASDTRSPLSVEQIMDFRLRQANLKSRGLEKKNASRRSFKTAEEPLHIRLTLYGFHTKIYTSYQWQEDNENFLITSALRTTPGRIFFNQIIQKYL